MLSQIHHVAIICSDHEKSLEFYQKIGFHLIRDVWRPERQDHLTMLQLGSITLELFSRPDAPQRVTDPEALGLRHLAFQVDRMEEAVRWLKNLGIETEPVREDGINGGKMTFFRDPDGLPLELHES